MASNEGNVQLNAVPAPYPSPQDLGDAERKCDRCDCDDPLKVEVVAYPPADPQATRRYFAACALDGLLSGMDNAEFARALHRHNYDRLTLRLEIARHAWAMADAMLATEGEIPSPPASPFAHTQQPQPPSVEAKGRAS